MPDLFELVKEFKQIIEGNYEGPFSNEVFIEDSANRLCNQIFVNPKLLPSHIQLPDTLERYEYDADLKEKVKKLRPQATQEQREEYNNKVWQALWNIANNCQDGYWSAMHNTEKNTLFFKVIDYTWVPKIFDEKMLQVGKIIQEFFIEALKEDTTVSFGAKNLANISILKMQKILHQRLTVYELHESKEIQDYIKRIALWHLRANLFREEKEKANSFSIAMWSIINNKKISVDDLEKHFTTLQEINNQLRQSLDDFSEFNNQWFQENQENNLPHEIQTSSFIRAVINNNTQKIISEWTELYIEDKLENEEKPELYPLNITALFEEKKLELIEDGKVLLTGILSAQIEELIQRITETRSLHTYKAELALVLQSYPMVVVPDVIEGDYPDWVLRVVLSEHAHYETNLNENITVYTQAFNKLGFHQQELLIQKDKLLEQYSFFNQQHALPEGYENSSLFIKAQDEVKETLLALISDTEKQINASQKLMQKTLFELRHYEYELLKLNRIAALESANQRVIDSFSNCHGKADIHYINMKSQYDNFLQQHLIDIETTIKKYAPFLERNKKNIDSLLAEISLDERDPAKHLNAIEHRKIFLQEGKSVLEAYLLILEKHMGLYFPAATISKKKLKKYLEDSQETNELIDELYEDEKESGRFYGLNFKNIKYRITTYSNFFQSPYAKIEELSDIIKKKIISIDAELKADFTNQDLAPKNKKNLWYLYQIHQASTDLKQLATDFQQLMNEKNKDLALLESKKLIEHEKLNSVIMDYKLAILENQQAVLALKILKFEYAIHDIREANQLFNNLNFSQLSKEALLFHFQEHKEKMTLAMSPSDTINQSVSYLSKQWEEFYKLDSNLKNSELAAQFQKLEQKFVELNQCHDELNTTLINQSIDVQQLAELADMMALALALMEGAASLDTDNLQEIEELSKGIALLEENLEKRIDSIAANQNPVVQEKYHSASQLFQKLFVLKNEFKIALQKKPEQANKNLFFFKVPAADGEMQSLHNKYFAKGKKIGIFIQYQNERHNTYWFKDLMSTIAAWFLGDSRYKTEAQERAEYLQTLELALTNSEREPDNEEYSNLVAAMVEQGKQNFSPRVKQDKEPEKYQKSLHAKLSEFYNDLQLIELENNASLEI